MTAGYLLQRGDIKRYFVTEADLWAVINYTFSSSCSKRSTYKFGLIKAIIDNLFCVHKSDRGLELSYKEIFSKFAENYWNIVTKYHLKQMRPDGKSSLSKLEQIFTGVLEKSHVSQYIEFENLNKDDRETIIDVVIRQCKKNVLGALYNDFGGLIYGFDLKEPGIWINPVAYEFLLKYKIEIEQLNYFAWAKFMESINSDEALVRVLDKLEMSSPHRQSLLVYRKILEEEFECCNCFYCGKKLQRTTHVDHVIPWNYIKGDYIWNFVLACPSCNIKKKDKLPNEPILSRVVVRNEKLLQSSNPLVCRDLTAYTPKTLWMIWDYAKLGGIRIME